jgi:ATP-dependent DNA ligase
MNLAVTPPIEPMLAKPVGAIPPDMLYEPKWDGFRAIIFRDGEEVEIFSRNARPLARYFPEIVTAARESLPPRSVVDGEIIVTDPTSGRLDFWSLQQRLHPAESRVRLLAETTPADFVGFDVLALGDTDLMGRPFLGRRHQLEEALAGSVSPVHLCPLTDSPSLAMEWFESLEGAGLDGVIAKTSEDPYRPGQRVMYKVKHDRTLDCVVAGYREHKSGNRTVGSLLLGLYADEAAPANEWSAMFNELLPIGVASSFRTAERERLAEELKPLEIDIVDHPWHPAEGAAEGRPGSRWNPEKDLSFVPLRPERVAEVRYNHMDMGRLRHPAKFLRWRPDRDPISCGFGQLGTAKSQSVGALLALGLSAPPAPTKER